VTNTKFKAKDAQLAMKSW